MSMIDPTESFGGSTTDEQPDQQLDSYAKAATGVEEIDEWPIRYEGLTQDDANFNLDVARTPAVSNPFATKNADAVPVYERASDDFTVGSFVLTSAQGPQMIGGRRKGRKYILLEVPTSFVGPLGAVIAPLGILFGRDPGEVANGVGWQLNVGDSIELDTEAPIYASPLPGAASGVVLFAEFFNLPGGTVAP